MSESGAGRGCELGECGEEKGGRGCGEAWRGCIVAHGGARMDGGWRMARLGVDVDGMGCVVGSANRR